MKYTTGGNCEEILVLQSLHGTPGSATPEHPTPLSRRNLYESDGKFVVDHINDWQHSSMYSVFLLSGLIDLATRMGVLPAGLDSAGIGMCFLAEGLLLVFHLKGPSIEIIVHLILVIQVGGPSGHLGMDR